MDAPVDGFTVEHVPGAGTVTLTLSNRYGEADQFTLAAVDAGRIGLSDADPGARRAGRDPAARRLVRRD